MCRIFAFIAENPVNPPTAPAATDDWHGVGTILVANDEPGIRQLLVLLLNGLGFSILAASNGQEAIELYRKHAQSINLVILVLTMPQLDGIEAFRELSKIDPDIPAVLSSGYGEGTPDSSSNHFALTI